MTALPNDDLVLAAIVAKADGLRAMLAAKVDGNLAGAVLHERTGALRASIVATSGADNAQVWASVESIGVPYAAIQEYGGRTAAHDIVATKAQALRFVVGGEAVYARVVHHPGSAIPARSYLRSALAALASEITDGLKAAALAALRS